MTSPPHSERFFERIASNVVTLLLGRIVQKILGFILLWFVVRWWSTESFGLYSFLMTWIVLVGGVSDMGMSAVGMRLWAENRSRMAQTLPRLYTLRLAFLGIGLLISVPIWLWFYGNLPLWGLALVCIGILPQIQSVAMIPFQAELKNRLPMIWSNVNRAFTILLIIGAILAGAGVPLVMIIEILLSFLLLGKLVREAGCIAASRRTEAPLYTFKELFADIAPAGLLGFLNLAYFRADIFMLMSLRGEHDVGLYAASFRVVEPLLVLPGILAMTLIPVAISRHASEDHEGFWRTVRRAARVITLLQIALAFVIARYSADIVRLVFGAAYEPTGPIMAALVWTLPLSAWSYAWSMCAMAERRYARLNILAASALAINVAGNFWVIPTMGGYGCAIVTVITELFWSLGQSLPYARRHGGWSIATTLGLAALAAWGSAFLIDRQWPGMAGHAAATLSGLMIMAVIARLGNLVTSDDLDGLRSYVKSIRKKST